MLGKIKLEFLEELVNGMVESGRAEWVGKNARVQALLLWYKPEEWANIISNWVFPHFSRKNFLHRWMRPGRRILY